MNEQCYEHSYYRLSTKGGPPHHSSSWGHGEAGIKLAPSSVAPPEGVFHSTLLCQRYYAMYDDIHPTSAIECKKPGSRSLRTRTLLPQ